MVAAEYPDVIETLSQAADTITLLRAALEGLVRACDEEDSLSDSVPRVVGSYALQAARAALREVGR